jgi:hypothetical protein
MVWAPIGSLIWGTGVVIGVLLMYVRRAWRGSWAGLSESAARTLGAIQATGADAPPARWGARAPFRWELARRGVACADRSPAPAAAVPVKSVEPREQLPTPAQLAAAIRRRRSVFPQHYTGETVPPASIAAMLEAADWAPSHGRTEPWRFVVLGPRGIHAMQDVTEAATRRLLAHDPFELQVGRRRRQAVFIKASLLDHAGLIACLLPARHIKCGLFLLAETKGTLYNQLLKQRIKLVTYTHLPLRRTHPSDHPDRRMPWSACGATAPSAGRPCPT